MRKDTTFIDGKLSPSDFSKKYWQDGESPHQYHTMEVSDGRDEREQLEINNIRALWDVRNFDVMYQRPKIELLKKQVDLLQRTVSTMTWFSFFLAVIAIFGIVFTMVTQ